MRRKLDTKHELLESVHLCSSSWLRCLVLLVNQIALLSHRIVSSRGCRPYKNRNRPKCEEPSSRTADLLNPHFCGVEVPASKPRPQGVLNVFRQSRHKNLVERPDTWVTV